MDVRILVLLALVCVWDEASGTATYDYDADFEEIFERMFKLEESLKSMVRRHTSQRLYIDERTRSEGDSGIKQVRGNKFGTKSYYSDTHTGSGVASIHNHANNKYTIGMGEVIAVLNGVEFRTRHNDFALNQPSKSSSDFHAFDSIDLPGVPLNVSQKSTVEDEIKEMKEYFKAFATQNPSLRDYRPYFRPVLCYLEGTWLKGDQSFEDLFPSDRHFINARSWFDMEQQIRFNGYTGSKDSGENQAYLPTMVVGIENGTHPIIAQWSYRIMCHPLSGDLPLDRFRVIDDLATRMERGGKTMDEFEKTRAARFQINPKKTGEFRDGEKRPMFLDELMAEIPGMNNYGAHFTDNAYNIDAIDPITGSPLNAANYHRLYKLRKPDAMGHNLRERGFADQNMFVAVNNQDRVVGAKLKICGNEDDNLEYKDCPEIEQKLSFAIPLEILYLTPLTQWNPYDLEYHGEKIEAPLVGGRDGLTRATALKGTARRLFYQTPADFFSGPEVDIDAADTAGDAWVEDKLGGRHLLQASGHRVFFPDIAGVGIVRQRYPIAPLHGEGSMFRKEIDALKDVVLRPVTNAHMFYEKFDGLGSSSKREGSTINEDSANSIPGE